MGRSTDEGQRLLMPSFGKGLFVTVMALVADGRDEVVERMARQLDGGTGRDSGPMRAAARDRR